MGHLQDIGESYWDHFKFAIRIAFVLFLTSLVLVAHAFFPNVFKNVASDVVMHLHAIFEARKKGSDESFDSLSFDNENETGVS